MAQLNRETVEETLIFPDFDLRSAFCALRSPPRRCFVLCLLFIITFNIAPVFGWAHQGHILLTRLACLRIIDDPAAPPGLRKFLRTNMPADEASCEKLAVEEYVGLHPDDFATGIDREATMPDQVKYLPEGKDPIAPFGASEGPMHYLDSEIFSPGDHLYKTDLSNKPDFLTVIPFDATDLRFKRAGFVPLRAQQSYDELVAALIARENARRPAGGSMGGLSRALH